MHTEYTILKYFDHKMLHNIIKICNILNKTHIQIEIYTKYTSLLLVRNKHMQIHTKKLSFLSVFVYFFKV